MSSATQTYGANIAFIEELYEKYRANPDSVSASWREFFHDYQPQLEEDLADVVNATPLPAPDLRPATPPSPPPPSRPTPVPPPPSTGNAVPLRGAAAKLAQNMEPSLAVPTATSTRTIPVHPREAN